MRRETIQIKFNSVKFIHYRHTDVRCQLFKQTGICFPHAVLSSSGLPLILHFLLFSHLALSPSCLQQTNSSFHFFIHFPTWLSSKCCGSAKRLSDVRVCVCVWLANCSSSLSSLIASHLFSVPFPPAVIPNHSLVTMRWSLPTVSVA